MHGDMSYNLEISIILDSFFFQLHIVPTEEDVVTPSFIIIRDVQPRIHPDGNDGSSDTGVMGISLKLHWHSCVTKFGTTFSDRPKVELKKFWAGILH